MCRRGRANIENKVSTKYLLPTIEKQIKANFRDERWWPWVSTSLTRLAARKLIDLEQLVIIFLAVRIVFTHLSRSAWWSWSSIRSSAYSSSVPYSPTFCVRQDIFYFFTDWSKRENFSNMIEGAVSHIIKLILHNFSRNFMVWNTWYLTSLDRNQVAMLIDFPNTMTSSFRI